MSGQPSGTSLSLVLSIAMICALAAGAQQKPAPPRATRPSQELRAMGEAIAKAVLDKNIPALLAYDRADSRAQDEARLKNDHSDLYCYIFDSECITWGDGEWRSVYDKLSQAHPLQIRVSVLSSRYDRQVYGTLLFYDASSISDKELRTPDFLCKEAPAKVASWRFRRENGKWKAATPIFDSETLGACPSVTQEE